MLLKWRENNLHSISSQISNNFITKFLSYSPPRLDELNALDAGLFDSPAQTELGLFRARALPVLHGEVVAEVAVEDAAEAARLAEVALGGQDLDGGQHRTDGDQAAGGEEDLRESTFLYCYRQDIDP